VSGTCRHAAAACSAANSILVALANDITLSDSDGPREHAPIRLIEIWTPLRLGSITSPVIQIGLFWAVGDHLQQLR